MRLSTLLTIALLTACFIPSQAQTPTVADFFRKAPTTIFLTDSITALDMLDYYRSGSDKASRTIIGGNIRVTSETNTSLTLMSGESTSYQIALLPTRTDTLIAVIETLGSHIPDSHINFYDTSWKPVHNPHKIFTQPTLGEWLTQEGKEQRCIVEEKVPFLLISYRYDETEDVLKLTNNIADYFVEEDWRTLEPLLRKELRFKWNSSKFNLIKP